MKEQCAGRERDERPVAHEVTDNCQRITRLPLDLAAVRTIDIDFLCANETDRDEGRNAQGDGDEKHRLFGEQIAPQTHAGGGKDRSNRRKARIAAQPFADPFVTHEPQADGRDRRSQQAIRQSLQHRHAEHDAENRMNDQRERACADGDDRQRDQQALRSNGIDQSASRYLTHQGNQSADGQDEPDFGLRPILRGQVNRYEWDETGLDIGEEENKPIESALTLARRRRRNIRHVRWPNRQTPSAAG